MNDLDAKQIAWGAAVLAGAIYMLAYFWLGALPKSDPITHP